jgi:hypothetical protein
MSMRHEVPERAARVECSAEAAHVVQVFHNEFAAGLQVRYERDAVADSLRSQACPSK